MTQRAKRLAARVAAVPDAQLRVTYVRHELTRLEAAELADLMCIVHAAASEKRAPYPTLLLSASIALTDKSVAALREAASGAAASRGHVAVARLLASVDDSGDAALPVPDFGRGRPLTLGERKSLARGRDRRLLLRAIKDPHPDVVTILLRNPALTEDDIVRLCSQRPVARRVLETVFQSTRWIIRYRVRLALVQNPYCPEHVALPLVPHLTRGDAKSVARSTTLASSVLEACRTRIQTPTIH